MRSADNPKDPGRFRNILARIFRLRGADGMKGMDPEMLKGLVRAILSTRDDEYDCERCFDEMDEFVELILAGKNASEALPLVQDHLDRCPDCREEFEVLLSVIRSHAS